MKILILISALLFSGNAAAYFDIDCRKSYGYGQELVEVLTRWSSDEEANYSYGAESAFVSGPLSGGGSWGWDLSDYDFEWSVMFVSTSGSYPSGVYAVQGTSAIFDVRIINGVWQSVFHPTAPESCSGSFNF